MQDLGALQAAQDHDALPGCRLLHVRAGLAAQRLHHRLRGCGPDLVPVDDVGRDRDVERGLARRVAVTWTVSRFRVACADASGSSEPASNAASRVRRPAVILVTVERGRES